MREYKQYHVKVVNDATHELVAVCITRARSGAEALATVARRKRVQSLSDFTLTIITAENYAELIRVWGDN